MRRRQRLSARRDRRRPAGAEAEPLGKLHRRFIAERDDGHMSRASRSVRSAQRKMASQASRPAPGHGRRRAKMQPSSGNPSIGRIIAVIVEKARHGRRELPSLLRSSGEQARAVYLPEAGARRAAGATNPRGQPWPPKCCMTTRVAEDRRVVRRRSACPKPRRIRRSVSSTRSRSRRRRRSADALIFCRE